MAISLLGAVARHERRIRLLFDAPLSVQALTTPSLYAVLSDGGTAIGIAGLVLVAGQANVVELALAADLLEGALYTVRAAGVPATDGTVTAAGTHAGVRLGTARTPRNLETSADDIVELLYGVDCVWNGTDYSEAASGDLATVSGPENVKSAVERRLQSDGLLWDDTYGAKPRSYIDGAPAALTTLKGALLRQALADDRVKRATATLTTGDADASFDVTAELVGEGDSVTATLQTDALA